MLRTAALYRAPDTPWLHHVNEPGDGPAALRRRGDVVRDGWVRSAMDLVILFDWFTNESIEAALQATEWQQREMFLRLAASHRCLPLHPQRAGTPYEARRARRATRRSHP